MTHTEIFDILVAEISQQKDKEQKKINYHDAIARVLKAKYDGKKITKRIQEQIKTELNDKDLIVLFESPEFGSMTIRIWKSNYNEAVHFYLGAPTDKYNPATFEEKDFHGAHAKARNVVRQQLLDNTENLNSLAQMILKAQALRKEYKIMGEAILNLVQHYPDTYVINSLIEKA